MKQSSMAKESRLSKKTATTRTAKPGATPKLRKRGRPPGSKNRKSKSRRLSLLPQPVAEQVHRVAEALEVGTVATHPESSGVIGDLPIGEIAAESSTGLRSSSTSSDLSSVIDDALAEARELGADTSTQDAPIDQADADFAERAAAGEVVAEVDIDTDLLQRFVEHGIPEKVFRKFAPHIGKALAKGFKDSTLEFEDYEIELLAPALKMVADAELPALLQSSEKPHWTILTIAVSAYLIRVGGAKLLPKILDAIKRFSVADIKTVASPGSSAS